MEKVYPIKDLAYPILLAFFFLILLPSQADAKELKILYKTTQSQSVWVEFSDSNDTYTKCAAVFLREFRQGDNENTVTADTGNESNWRIFKKACSINQNNAFGFELDRNSKSIFDSWRKAGQKLSIVIENKDSSKHGFVGNPDWEELHDAPSGTSPPKTKCTESVSPGEPIPDECDLTTELTPYFSSCQNPPGFSDHLVVCLDAYNDDTPVISGLPQRANHVLPPNRPLLVMVRHREDRSVSINISGTRGLYRPTTLNLTGIGAQQAARGKNDPEPLTSSARRALISRRAFAPRTPDPIDLTVKVYQSANGEQKLVGQEVVEFIVEQTYGAAVRLGLAVVGGSAVDREYEVRSLATGQQSVAAKSFGTVNAELVLGFAPFIDFFRGGRGYSNWNNLSRFPFGISPYVGIGVVNASQNSLEVFKSIYLGGEWEISGNFSIAVTWVGRRVTRLADGVSEGMPVPEGTVTTVTGFDYGWGVILNLSPDFFRIAQKSGSSFFGR